MGRGTETLGRGTAQRDFKGHNGGTQGRTGLTSRHLHLSKGCGPPHRVHLRSTGVHFCLDSGHYLNFDTLFPSIHPYSTTQQVAQEQLRAQRPSPQCLECRDRLLPFKGMTASCTRHLPTPHWPELSHMVIASCKEVWGMLSLAKLRKRMGVTGQLTITPVCS